MSMCVCVCGRTCVHLCGCVVCCEKDGETPLIMILHSALIFFKERGEEAAESEWKEAFLSKKPQGCKDG